MVGAVWTEATRASAATVIVVVSIIVVVAGFVG